jgi:hypothetical protein
VRHEAGMEDIRNVFTTVIGRHEEMKIFGREEVILEAKFGKDIKDVEFECAQWTYLAQDIAQYRAFVKTLINMFIP